MLAYVHSCVSALVDVCWEYLCVCVCVREGALIQVCVLV